jgi:hypothetical protein
MRSLLTDRSPHRVGVLTLRTAAVVLLTPLVLLAGLLAVVGLTAVALGKRLSHAIPARGPAPKPVRRLEPAAADAAALGVVTRRAA